jgi:hypothetical protein
MDCPEVCFSTQCQLPLDFEARIKIVRKSNALIPIRAEYPSHWQHFSFDRPSLGARDDRTGHIATGLWNVCWAYMIGRVPFSHSFMFLSFLSRLANHPQRLPRHFDSPGSKRSRVASNSICLQGKSAGEYEFCVRKGWASRYVTIEVRVNLDRPISAERCKANCATRLNVERQSR